MIPIRDIVPRRDIPVVTWLLIGVNVVIFAYEAGMPASRLEALFYTRGIVPARFTDAGWADRVGLTRLDFTPFLSHMYLHGGLLHLVSNMWILWIFGDNVEDRMGKSKFFLFYTLCGVAAGFTHFVTGPGSRVPVVGASGAIAGVLGAYLFLYPLARVLCVIPIFIFPFFFEVPAFLFILVWFWIQFYSGTLALLETAVGGVAWWAHIGGFVAGVGFHRGFLSKRRPPPPPTWRERSIPGPTWRKPRW